MNGASNTNSSGAGLALISLDGWDVQCTLYFGFFSTNNEAEYEVLITSLTITKEMGVRHLKAHSDSWLVVSHVLNKNKAQE